MRGLVTFAMLCGAAMAFPMRATSAALDIVDVGAPAINCVFDLDCIIVVTDTSDHFKLNGTSGDAFLQSRTFPPGEPTTVAQGLYGYEYRLDLRKLVGILNIPCITSYSIDFGPVVPLDYDGNGTFDDVFVVTSGGLGTVAPTTANQIGNTITFKFETPVCAGGSPGNGESTFFFGLTSAFPPQDVKAQVQDTSGVSYTLSARAPFSGEILNHFQCYKMEGEPIEKSVRLRDQFGIEQARVREAIRFCNPVEKRHHDAVTPIRNRAAHLKFYRIETRMLTPKRQVIVSNQFGKEQKLSVSKPEFLAVPTQKLRHQPPKGVDHFKCYAARGESVDAGVALEDQFHAQPRVKVHHPVALCNPVEKTHDRIVAPIQNPDNHLVCYEIEAAPVHGGVVARNQFGIEISSVERADLLCVPSRKLRVSTEEERHPVPGEVTNDIVEAAARQVVPPKFQCKSPPPDFVVTGSETVVPGDEHCFPSNGLGGFGPRSDIPRLNSVDGMDVADMDGDGDNDFLVCNGPKGEVYLYTQGPLGLFIPSLVASGVTAGTGGSLFCTYLREGDFNEDGQKDFVVGDNRVTKGMFVYLQGPPGTFTQVLPGLDVSWASPSGNPCNCLFGVAVGDVDGDAHQDVLVLGYNGSGSGQVQFYKGDGAGGMAAPALKFDVNSDFPIVGAPTGLALFDRDGDGDLDAIAGGSANGSHYIYTNNGVGNFAPPPGAVFDVDNFTGIDAFDVNGDNNDDLMLVDWSARRLLYVQNMGGGGLAPPAHVGNVDGPSIGIGAPQLRISRPTGLDHFKCYQTEGKPIEKSVRLRDQFGTEKAQVLETLRFCNPVEKRHGEVVTKIKDQDAHLQFYRIDTGTHAEKTVLISNQFGKEQKFEVLKPVFLAVPTQKLEPKRHEAPKNLDHFKCYEARGEPVQAELALRDQFGEEPRVKTHEPVVLCNPVAKTHENNEVPIQNPEDHLMCYKLDGTQLATTVQGRNQFGEEVLKTEPADMLCVPSQKKILQ